MSSELEKKLDFLSKVRHQPAVHYVGVTFSDLLTILFIALKLVGTIHWSWLYVLAPMLIPIVLKVLFNWNLERKSSTVK